LVSVICDFLIVFFLIAIYRLIFRQQSVIAFLLGFASAVLYLFNFYVDYAFGFAWNHDAVTLAVVISFWLFITADFKGKTCSLRVFLIGGILTLAACMRITTAVIWLFFLIFILIKSPGTLKRKFRITLPFLLATVIVLIWPAWVIAQSPKAFFINIYRIPSLNGKLLHGTGLTLDRLFLTINSITRPEYFLLILIAIYLYSTCLYYRKKTSNFDITNLAFAALLAIIRQVKTRSYSRPSLCSRRRMRNLSAAFRRPFRLPGRRPYERWRIENYEYRGPEDIKKAT